MINEWLLKRIPFLPVPLFFQLSLQLMALGAQGQQFQHMLAQNPLLAAMAMSSGGLPPTGIPPPTSVATSGTAPVMPGLPSAAAAMPPMFPGLPGLSPPGMPPAAPSSEPSMLNAMTQLQSLFMMNNPTASSQSAILQNQVS